MIKIPIPSNTHRPNQGLALLYLFEGLVGTLALLLTAAIFMEGSRGDDSMLLVLLALMSIPGYVLQWGYVQYLRGKLRPRGRWWLWMGTMVLNLLLVPVVLVPTGFISTMGSDEEALFVMVPLVANMLLVSGLGIFGFWREHRALAA